MCTLSLLDHHLSKTHFDSSISIKSLISLSFSQQFIPKQAMKEKEKAMETYTDFNYSSLDLLCYKHPSSSSIGICTYYLKERLIKLVCSDCGEQRLSSCSCPGAFSYRNSSTTDVGSVGRVSFLIENERIEAKQS
ncbi:50S ribosomal protein [Actinidia chinensis var. chinensis]|uniref:50S ribosomal protein n=1 Tax=Actinidia chinensis var. chinensis TaxID=1590841 RepID=A0A2R6QHW7_ACTCC|nr:50S ribosomal protein [Actinidia chinensis var. chinensis]